VNTNTIKENRNFVTGTLRRLLEEALPKRLES
jgi:hypothetical protein